MSTRIRVLGVLRSIFMGAIVGQLGIAAVWAFDGRWRACAGTALIAALIYVVQEYVEFLRVEMQG